MVRSAGKWWGEGEGETASPLQKDYNPVQLFKAM
jgi:hypothetical protein